MCDYPPLALYIVNDDYYTHLVYAHTKDNAIQLVFDNHIIHNDNNKEEHLDTYKKKSLVIEVSEPDRPTIIRSINKNTIRVQTRS